MAFETIQDLCSVIHLHCPWRALLALENGTNSLDEPQLSEIVYDIFTLSMMPITARKPRRSVMPQNPLVVRDFFNQARIEPSIFSQVTIDARVQQRFVAQRDVIVLSAFEGGPPHTILSFIDPREIQQVHDPQNLHISGVELINYMKVPSFDQRVRGAYRIYTDRVGTPTQSTITLVDALAANVMTLTSKDYGTQGNQLSVEVVPGSVVGRQLLLRFGALEVLVIDNLQDAFHIAYAGNGSACTLTITRTGDVATRLQTAVTSSTDGSVGLDIDLTLPDFATIQSLARYVNLQNGYRASLDPYTDPLLPVTELDTHNVVDIQTPSALLIHYIGTGTAATMSTTNTALTTVITGTPADNLNIDLTAAGTDTLGEVVAFIDALGPYTCTLAPGADRNARVVFASNPSCRRVQRTW